MKSTAIACIICTALFITPAAQAEGIGAALANPNNTSGTLYTGKVIHSPWVVLQQLTFQGASSENHNDTTSNQTVNTLSLTINNTSLTDSLYMLAWTDSDLTGQTVTPCLINTNTSSYNYPSNALSGCENGTSGLPQQPAYPSSLSGVSTLYLYLASASFDNATYSSVALTTPCSLGANITYDSLNKIYAISLSGSSSHTVTFSGGSTCNIS